MQVKGELGVKGEQQDIVKGRTQTNVFACKTCQNIYFHMFILLSWFNFVFYILGEQFEDDDIMDEEDEFYQVSKNIRKQHY